MLGVNHNPTFLHMTLTDLKKTLRAHANPEQAKKALRFFKTGRGEYGAGDRFLGIPVPTLRKISRECDLSLGELQELLDSPLHEERLIALFILIRKYNRADDEEREEIYRYYRENSGNVNNWDLVDSSAPHIVGKHLLHRDKEILFQLAASSNLWERRIAIVATGHFIKSGHMETTLRIAEMLIGDEHDLIHKAVGWMLREIGKREFDVEKRFLDRHYRRMPRTMLRYALERFPEDLRQRYLRGEI